MTPSEQLGSITELIILIFDAMSDWPATIRQEAVGRCALVGRQWADIAAPYRYLTLLLDQQKLRDFADLLAMRPGLGHRIHTITFDAAALQGDSRPLLVVLRHTKRLHTFRGPGRLMRWCLGMTGEPERWMATLRHVDFTGYRNTFPDLRLFARLPAVRHLRVANLENDQLHLFDSSAISNYAPLETLDISVRHASDTALNLAPFLWLGRTAAATLTSLTLRKSSFRFAIALLSVAPRITTLRLLEGVVMWRERDISLENVLAAASNLKRLYYRRADRQVCQRVIDTLIAHLHRLESISIRGSYIPSTDRYYDLVAACEAKGVKLGQPTKGQLYRCSVLPLEIDSSGTPEAANWSEDDF